MADIDSPNSFLESAMPTKVEYEASLKLSPEERIVLERAAVAKRTAAASAVSSAASDAEAASFTFGGTPARPRKTIEGTLVSGATFLKPPGSCLSKVPGAAVTLECCEQCQLYVLDPCEQVMCFELLSCRIVVGPCVGSVVFSKCVDCTITAAARETRLSDCFNCEVRATPRAQSQWTPMVRCRAAPVLRGRRTDLWPSSTRVAWQVRVYAPTRKCVALDSCAGLRFGAWDVAYQGLAKQWASVAPKWMEADARNYWDTLNEVGLVKGAKPCYSLLSGVHPAGRWCQLTIAPEGLNGGTVTETRSNTPSVEGCECPVAAQDGKKFA